MSLNSKDACAVEKHWPILQKGAGWGSCEPVNGSLGVAMCSESEGTEGFVKFLETISPKHPPLRRAAVRRCLQRIVISTFWNCLMSTTTYFTSNQHKTFILPHYQSSYVISTPSIVLGGGETTEKNQHIHVSSKQLHIVLTFSKVTSNIHHPATAAEW